MKFVIRDANGGFGDLSSFEWQLERKDGSPVCRSVEQPDGWGFPTEAEARSDVAKAKIAMRATKFAKVEVADA